jgi:hypothetical protein
MKIIWIIAGVLAAVMAEPAVSHAQGIIGGAQQGARRQGVRQQARSGVLLVASLVAL